MRARAVLLAVLAIAAAPAFGQYKVPDDLPALPEDGAACNEKRTHCIVNARDWMADHMALDIAGELLARREAEVAALRAELEVLKKSKRCAVLLVPEGEHGARADR